MVYLICSSEELGAITRQERHFQLELFMFFTDLKNLIASFFLLSAIMACTNGVQSGSIVASFSGINTATPVSPTSVKITWTRADLYKFYDIYADYSKEPILKDQIFGEALIENLTPGTSYKFKVLAKGATIGAGNDRQIEVKMWDRFTGITSTTKDGDGNIEVSWEYDKVPQEYYIFVGEEAPPTAASTNNWTKPTVITTAKKYLFKDLKGSTNYFFIVQAKYRQGEYERSLKALSNTTNSSFGGRESWVNVPRITIGALPSFQINIPSNPLFPLKNFTTNIYKDGQKIADPLVGSGKISFSSGVNFDLGSIKGISTKINYKDPDKGIDETFTISNQETYLKGLLPNLDLPPGTNLDEALGPAYLGKSLAKGDFNCDGFDDLAIGMPDTVIGSTGATNQNQGAVYVYYGGQKEGDRYYLRTSSNLPQTRQGIITPDPQLITFPDLNATSRFGTALAAGNMNRDQSGSIECDDLAVGAPGVTNKNGVQTGAVFLFFGSKSGIKYPSTASSIAENTSTCNGLIEDATCSPVWLWPDPTIWPSFQGGTSYVDVRSNHASFGRAIAFVGDFDANGYSELAIGAPNAPWDGDLGDFYLPQGYDNRGVGYVSLYFGSAYGLGRVSPTTDGSARQFRYLKIYPPIAQPFMAFGSSIAGGVDVDGGNRVLLANGSYAGGADMVIGAPGFVYRNPASGTYPVGLPGQGPGDTKNVSVYPANGAWWGDTFGSNPYGLNASSANGVAFVFFGRRAENNSLSEFWACGKRGSSADSLHFSCLADSDRFRVLFPRDSESVGFGTSVAMLGDSNSDYAPSTPLCDGLNKFLCRDPNADGFGEIIVAASSAGNTTKPGTGALWQFFGNPMRMYERGNSAGDQFTLSYLTSPDCTTFKTSATKSRCAPTRLRSPSMPARTNIGLYQSSMAVADINRDGLMDLIVGGPNYNPDGFQPSTGAAFMFPSTRNAGISATYSVYTKSTALAEKQGYDRLGYAVVGGDFDPIRPRQDQDAYKTTLTNIDTTVLSFNDIAAGAPFDEVHRNSGGAVHFFYSGGTLSNPTTLPSSLSTAKNLNAIPPEIIVDRAASPQESGYGFTRAVGDINGDGFEDAVSQIKGYDPKGNTTYSGIVYFGSPIGLITTQYCLDYATKVFISGDTSTNRSYCQPAITHPIGVTNDNIVLPQLLRKPNNLATTWAYQAFAAGDVNGDGFADVLFVDSFVVPNSIVLYFGSRSGLQDIVVPSDRPNSSDPQIVSQKLDLVIDYNSSWYYSIHRDYRYQSQVVHGDFNRDGFSDVAISDPLATGPSLTSSTTTSDGQTIAILPDATTAVTPDQRWVCPNDIYRESACAGSGASAHGATWVFYGSALGLQTPRRNNGTDIDVPSNVVGIYNSVTNSAQRACNPDTGECKVSYIRNPVYFNSNIGYRVLDQFFGSSMTVMNYNAGASGISNLDAGDYDDLLISAPGYENPGCVIMGASAPETNQGRIFLYAGSRWGLVASDFGDYWPSSAAKGEMAQGMCGIMSLEDDETGLGAEPDPTKKLNALRMPIAVNPAIPSTAANTSGRNFGLRITAAGDLNGDGQEDLAVAAPYETVEVDGTVVTNGGAVYIYYGPFCPPDNDRDVLMAIQNAEYGKATYSINKQLTLTGLQVPSNLKGSCGAKNLAPQKIVVRDSNSNNRYYGWNMMGRRIINGRNKSDVNGELLFPLSDLVIGTPYFNDFTSGANQTGRGVIFFGSAPNGDYPGGLFADDFPSYVVETISGTKVKPYILKMPTVPYINFFALPGSTGDFNNDGSMDLLLPTNDYDIPPSSSGAGGINVGGLLLFF
jgi:hypothetical protein